MNERRLTKSSPSCPPIDSGPQVPDIEDLVQYSAGKVLEGSGSFDPFPASADWGITTLSDISGAAAAATAARNGSCWG